ncbi:MAG: DUF1254 domain-containing protein, partial [Betaproteobacteria bacterium]
MNMAAWNYKTTLLAMVAAAAVGLAGCGDQKPSTPTAKSDAPAAADAAKAKADSDVAAAKVKEAVAVATDAYVYGYSLITTEITRVQMSNVPKLEGLTAPMGQFINVPRYPPADYRGVSAPNADTLYSLAWLDLAEPQV